MPGEQTDFEGLDNEPDIGEEPGERVAGPTNTQTPLIDEEIDIKFAETAADDKGAQGGGDEEERTRDPARGHLQREQRLKREARARADSLEAEVQRLNAENATLRQKGADAGGSDDDIDSEIAATTKKFQQVRAEFDPEKSGEEAALIQKIAELQYRKQRKADGAQAGNNGASGAQQQAAPRVNPKVQEWMDKNDWFNNPDFERETRRARSIDAALHADGYRVEDEDYFQELERRLDKAGVKPPKRRTNGEAGNTQMKESPVAGGRVDAPTGGKRTVTLTRDDLAFMQTCGLDPKNKAHLKEFAMNKLQEARRDA